MTAASAGLTSPATDVRASLAERLVALAPFAIALLVLLVVWQVWVVVAGVSEIVLPGPLAIAAAGIEHFPEILANLAATLVVAGGGFVVGTVVGLALAVAVVYAVPLRTTAYPLALALQSIPVVAIGPALMIWLGNGPASKIVLAAILVMPIVAVNATRGLLSPDADALDMMRTLSASRWRELFTLRLPAALPYVFVALKLSVTAALVAAIAAEYIGSLTGIGFLLTHTKSRLEMPYLWAVVAVVTVVGVLLYGVIQFWQKRATPWSQDGPHA